MLYFSHLGRHNNLQRLLFELRHLRGDAAGRCNARVPLILLSARLRSTGLLLLVLDRLLADHLAELGRKPSVDRVQESDLVHLVNEARLLRHFSEDTRRQVEVNRVDNFVAHVLVRIS